MASLPPRQTNQINTQSKCHIFYFYFFDHDTTLELLVFAPSSPSAVLKPCLKAQTKKESCQNRYDIFPLQAYTLSYFIFLVKHPRNVSLRNAMQCIVNFPGRTPVLAPSLPTKFTRFFFLFFFLSFLLSQRLCYIAWATVAGQLRGDTVRYSTSGSYRYVELNFPTSCPSSTIAWPMDR